jgi:hypothetical protein
MQEHTGIIQMTEGDLLKKSVYMSIDISHDWKAQARIGEASNPGPESEETAEPLIPS